MVKKSLYLTFFLFVIGIIYFYLAFYPQLPVANGYAAKKMCSCTFISNRSQESIQNEDLGFGPLALTRTSLNLSQKSATSTLFGSSARTAIYRGNAGCILLEGEDDYNINIPETQPVENDTLSWPRGSGVSFKDVPSEVDLAKLSIAVDQAFDQSLNMDTLKTRAVVVVYKDQMIIEKYANGFDPSTEILGWSMTKSITGTMIGILIKNGILSLTDDHIFPEWDDIRKTITLKNMLQMQSGLDFNEDYNSLSDATRMLYISDDVTVIPKSKSLIYDPGTHWSYSSGTTNLLSGLVREKLHDNNDYHKFPYDSIFNRLGMTSAVIETDESGHFIGSSYCYATPRDWAKFGLLYLHNGNWYGDQVIDSSFVDFVRIPASDSKGIYGGQFWLNADHSAYPDVPADLYSCNGFQGQYVFIIPSYDLVIVRMGLAENPVFDVNNFLKSIIDSFDR